MATEKAESKPSTRKADSESGEDEEFDAENHPLTLARAEGLARNPLWQTDNIDTTESGGLVDVRKVSPMFEQARRDAVRHAAAVLDPEDDTPDDPNVILPDDEVEADRARADVKRQAAELGDPENDPVVVSNAHGGHGDLMGAEGRPTAPSNPEADQTGAGDEGTKSEGDKPVAGATSKPATKPGGSEAAKTSTGRTSTASKSTTRSSSGGSK